MRALASKLNLLVRSLTWSPYVWHSFRMESMASSDSVAFSIRMDTVWVREARSSVGLMLVSRRSVRISIDSSRTSSVFCHVDALLVHSRVFGTNGVESILGRDVGALAALAIGLGTRVDFLYGTIMHRHGRRVT